MVQDVSSFLQNKEGETYDASWADGRGVAESTDFEISGGKLRIWCADWIEEKEEQGYIDSIFVSISPNKFIDWLAKNHN